MTAAIMSEPLIPILLSGWGRSGTTALMSLLATDPRVAVDAQYPYEHRHLTYLARFAQLTGRVGNHDGVSLVDHAKDAIASPPWADGGPSLMPPPDVWLRSMWQTFSDHVRKSRPDATHYAEKAPEWVASVVRPVFPSATVHLVRDPRDVYLSLRDFSRRRGSMASFGIADGANDRQIAQHLAFGIMPFFVNQQADEGRPDSRCVRYEDWATDPAGVASNWNEWLGLSFDHSAASISKHLGIHATAQSTADSVGRWRREELPPGIRTRLPALVHEMMRKHGYELPECAPPVDLLPDPAAPHSEHGTWRRSNDSVHVEITGDDAWIELPGKHFSASSVDEYWLCFRSQVGNHHSIYWRGPNEAFDEKRHMHASFRGGSHWQVARIPVSRHPLWRGTIAQIRLDCCNGGTTPGPAEVRWLRVVA